MPSSRIVILFCLLVLGTEGRPTDDTINSVVNRTAETFSNIHNAVANYTKDFIDNVSNSMNNDTTKEGIVDKIKNCSIVIGGSLSGGVIGILVVGVVIPLALCVLGFTCWGVMAGSAAACCQSNIGNVPSGSCFSCMQSLGAGGGGCLVYLSIACIGILPGLYFGGQYTETYYHCFTSRKN